MEKDTEVKRKNIQELKVEHMEKIAETIYDALLTPNTAEVNNLPEEVFVEGFLPYFCGEKRIQDNKNFFPTWIGIAGSPAKEVAIMDRNNREIYRVPAVFSTKTIPTDSDNRLSNLFSEYQLQGSQLPVLGEKFMSEIVEHKSAEYTKDAAIPESEEQRWQQIFARYGKSFPKPINNTNIVDISGEDDDDDLVYD